MRAGTKHWRLGLFVLFVVGAALVAAVTLGECSSHQQTTKFVTYFDESVAGLDSGARVVFRGVDVGSVQRIAIAPDHRRVEVSLALDTAALPRMGIAVVAQPHGDRYDVPPALRAQIAGNGLTGVRNVAIDLVDPNEKAPPPLPFAVGSAYIPAETSTWTKLIDGLAKTEDRLPELVSVVLDDSRHLQGVLAELEREHVPGKATATLARADQVLGALRATVRQLDRAGVPEKTSQTLGDASRALAKIGRTLDGLSSSRRDVNEALDELRNTAEAVRELAEDLDRQPDMLLKGRAAPRSP